MGNEQGSTIEQGHVSEGSYWPVVLAVTITLIMVGLLLSSLIVSILASGLSVAAMIAWGLERFQGPEAATTTGRGDVELAPVRPVAFWGMVWFIATEATLFAFLVAAFIYLRAIAVVWPPAGTPEHGLAFPAANTVILLLSGVPAFYAERAIARDDRRGLQAGLLVAALMGAIFLSGQAYEYATSGMSLSTNIFAAGFFVLTGFHGVHVLVGISLLVIVLILSLRGRYAARNSFAVQFAGTYWHFVDIVWIFLFSLLYLFR